MMLFVARCWCFFGRTLLLALPVDAFFMIASNAFLLTLKTGNLPFASSVCWERVGT